jgi:hypothetical protein
MSRKTGYKIYSRYTEHSLHALTECSQRAGSRAGADSGFAGTLKRETAGFSFVEAKP